MIAYFFCAIVTVSVVQSNSCHSNVLVSSPDGTPRGKRGHQGVCLLSFSNVKEYTRHLKLFQMNDVLSSLLNRVKSTPNMSKKRNKAHLGIETQVS